MYYAHMSKNDILHSSRRFLYSVYQNYDKRACENLGVSDSEEDDDSLQEEDYPSEYRKFSQKEREEYIENSNMTDEEFLSGFEQYTN